MGIGYRRWAPRGVERASFGLDIDRKRAGKGRSDLVYGRFRLPVGTGGRAGGASAIPIVLPVNSGLPGEKSVAGFYKNM